MIMVLMKKSSFFVEGGDSENAAAYLILYYGGSGIHCYPRDESNEEVLEEEVAGYLRSCVVLSGRYSRS